MSTDIHLAKDFDLPIDAVLRRMAILGMSGSGKSNLAVAIAEGFSRNRKPWVAIDGKGDWWGVRSSKDGGGPGLSVPIFGGLHADVPLEPGAGVYIADLIVSERLTCVLDITEFEERQDMWRFLADFGRALLHKNRLPLHLFLEECDDYIPQTSKAGGHLPTCRGVMQRLVKRGRFRGIGCTQISQRSACIDKDTLYQAEVMFALRSTGKGDRDAILGWVEHSGSGKEIADSLPRLADGEGWVTSPAWLRKTLRTQFVQRGTYDSGATPLLAEGETERIATLADVDLDAIKKAMAATIERQQQEDPAALRKQLATEKKRVSELERDLKAERASKPEPAPVEVPVIDSATLFPLIDSLGRQASAIAEVLKPLQDFVADIRKGVVVQRMQAVADVARTDVPAAKKMLASMTASLDAPMVERPEVTREVAKPRQPKSAAAPTPASRKPVEGWDPVEEDQYQKWKTRLVAELKQEAPALIKVLATASELDVTVEQRTVDLDGSSLKGRIARLIAQDFYQTERTGGEVLKELRRTGPDVHPSNVLRTHDEFTAMGLLTRESGGFRVAPGAKVRLKKAG